MICGIWEGIQIRSLVCTPDILTGNQNQTLLIIDILKSNAITHLLGSSWNCVVAQYFCTLSNKAMYSETLTNERRS